jgi:hypothetical protein
MTSQIIQVAGALLVLAGFLAVQAHLLDQRSYAYLLPNAVGSGVLAGSALVTAEWGFLFLEGAWALVSLWGLVDRVRGADRVRGGEPRGGR